MTSETPHADREWSSKRLLIRDFNTIPLQVHSPLVRAEAKPDRGGKSEMTDEHFNYFSKIEEHFQRARGTERFLLSPSDWALVEAWRNAGIPLKAVLRGIDVVFEKRRKRPEQAGIQMVNSLAYCAKAIAVEAQMMAGAAQVARRETTPPFSLDDVRAFVARNAGALRKAGNEDLAGSLETLDLDALYGDLEQLEKRFTATEEKMIAWLRTAVSDEALLEARHALDQELKPYRGRMSANQLAILEKQHLEQWLLKASGLPRLSLFYV